MLLRNVPEKIDKLKKHHDTNNPFTIAKEREIEILYGDFGDDVFGFYNKVSRIKFIHLNTRLSETSGLFVCAHELFHAIFHPNENTPKLSKITLVSTSKIEAQANAGATHLLIDGSHKEILRNPTKLEILNFYGIPSEMERYI